MSNSSSITLFILLAITDIWELQLLHFRLFLGIYLAALLGNGLIITTIACDDHLHTPMYFFLLNLSLLNLGSVTITVPKAMANSLWGTRAISYLGFMAYDRYVAISKPLHYGTLLGGRACSKMAVAAWVSVFPYAVLHTVNTFSLPLCKGNAVNQFFCEVPQILNLSCSDAYLSEIYLLVHFNVCLPVPPSISSPSLELVVSVLYSVVPPAVNPLIYSMRNQEIKDALKKLFEYMLHQHH
ncbi:olfactory receptor 14C36-like [Caloenas nicobarica]|uniref:olfactory receptor 14C36-like n=1 Tax=Caloenas nicobarica TaxID=187106 RepID=UPI0032B7C890